jgi:hypothetical protein
VIALATFSVFQSESLPLNLECLGCEGHSSLVYLCGYPGMIKDATAALVPRGWAVLAEQFWPLRPQK